jgi:hypothetical protein
MRMVKWETLDIHFDRSLRPGASLRVDSDLEPSGDVFSDFFK